MEGIALHRLDSSIDLILETLNTREYECILSPTDRSNYRYKLYPDYKANRTAPKPNHYYTLRDHLITAHNATIAIGEEADDLLGITQCATLKEDSTIIVSIDKDLNQIPGNHFQFVKGEQYYVSPIMGTRWFYKQLLIGDTADNLRGITGLGPVKAGRFLDDVEDEREMYQITLELYISEYGADAESKLLNNGQLFWIRRTPGELWQPPESIA